MKENKIDKIDMLRKLKKIQDKPGILEEIDSSQFNDMLLDEHILAEESLDEDQIAMEAHHQSSNTNNLYKLRSKEKHARNERPKTSHSIHRLNSNSISD